MKLATITEGFFETELRCRYDARVVEIVKDFPGKRWDPEIKIWVIPAEFTEELVINLRILGYHVNRDGPRKARTEPPTPPPPRPPRQTWAEQLLEAVGPQRHEPVVRALSKVLHPDVATGDTVLMQQLLDARAKTVSR